MADLVPSVTLGIDLGSTSTRAFLWCPESRQAIVLKNRPKKQTWSRYERGDFSSIGYPFDTRGPTYLEERTDPGREAISLKYAFYILANASDSILEQYLLVQPLLSRKHDHSFVERLRQGLKALLTRLRDRVVDACGDLRLVGNIGLSIPSQWDLDFEAVYRALVAEVFQCPASSIHFVTETEALAHYLCEEQHLDKLLRRQGESVGDDVLLFLDFGGHNMNSCIFNVFYGDDERPSIYLLDTPEGAGGGSEQWDYNVAQLCMDFIEQDGGQHLSPKARQALLDEFSRDKGGLGPGQADAFRFDPVAEDGNVHPVYLSPEKLTQCFEEALKGPLLLAEAKIKQLADIADAKARVIVSGGTARHEGLQRRLESLCVASHLPRPIFTDDIDITFDSVKIAKGTAYALASSFSVQEFFDRGAAIGLQRLPRGTNGNRNPDGLWEDYASFLTSKSRSETIEMFATGLDEFKIVCDPFFERTEGNEWLHYKKSYDIAYLGTPPRGWWYFTVTLETKEHQASLVLRREYQSFKRIQRKLYDTKVLPVFYNDGSNCIIIGSETEDPAPVLLSLLDYPNKHQQKEQNSVQPLRKRSATKGRGAKRVRGGQIPRAKTRTGRPSGRIRGKRGLKRRNKRDERGAASTSESQPVGSMNEAQHGNSNLIDLRSPDCAGESSQALPADLDAARTSDEDLSPEGISTMLAIQFDPSCIHVNGKTYRLDGLP